jgi:hypothetical protein
VSQILIASLIPPISAAIVTVVTWRSNRIRNHASDDQPRVLLSMDGKDAQFEPSEEERVRLNEILTNHLKSNK